MNRNGNGFSLIELMIVIAILTSLLTLGYPSYAGFVRKANRADAQATLLDWANRQQVWRADNPSYSTDMNPTNSDYYTYTMTSTANAFTLTATAIGAQTDDESDGTACPTLTLNQAGTVGPSGYEKCWAR